ncbi:MAG: EAL domain-containing protein [Alphaproteobacteria bacterium]|nr:EAL domain-containing protein [Alphaproteobacteria bacterium]
MFFFNGKKTNNQQTAPSYNEPKFDVAPKISTESYDGWSEKNPITFLNSLMVNNLDVEILFLDATVMKTPKSSSLLSKAVDEFLIDFTRHVDGRIFELVNKSVILVFNTKHQDEFQALLVRLQFAFNEELVLSGSSHILETEFAQLYTSKDQIHQLLDKITNATPLAPKEPPLETQSSILNKITAFTAPKKKFRDLTPSLLDKLQKSLLQVDFSSLIRRQSVCAIIGKSAPQMIFEEVFVAIPDLRDILLPDVNLTSSPWLFANLTETLDKRVLAHVSQHDDGSLVSNFSLNLNVSTILSDEFMDFDESIPPPLRSTIVLELQLADIFNDTKAFLLAKAFAQYRGYKICIDGITVDKLQYVNRENLNSDLMKIIWHPSFLDVINEDKHFRDYVNKAERAKMILCRVDDPKAIEIGNSLGINLYQGRYVQRELNKYRK